MNNKENIISAIAQKTDVKVQEIIAKAQNEAKILIENAESAVQKEIAEFQSKAKDAEQDTISRRITVATLDGKKYLLAQKRQIIDSVYLQVKNVVENLPLDQYKKFLAKLISENAEKGESVAVNKKDGNVVTQSFLAGFKLDLHKADDVDIDGGAILYGDGYEKDLSLTSLVDAIRQETEIEVCDVLFGETK